MVYPKVRIPRGGYYKFVNKTLNESTWNLQVLEDIRQHGIKIYDFPECDQDESEEFKRQDAELKVSYSWASTYSMLYNLWHWK